jgi:hypothetical protein
MHEHLSVGPRTEAMPDFFEIRSELPVVVDLSVVGHEDGSVFVGERLVRLGRKVEDTEPGVAQQARHTIDAALLQANRIWTPVSESQKCLADALADPRPRIGQKTHDAAHYV